MAPERLAIDAPGVVSGQCCSCGAYDSAEWTLSIVRDRSADMRAVIRICDTCYRLAIAGLMDPEHEAVPLRGYR